MVDALPQPENAQDLELTADEAVELLRKAAWREGPDEFTECPNCGYHSPEKPLSIHTFGASFGADWNLDAAEDFIRGAQRIRWRWSLVRHDLIARNGEVVRRFSVEAPSEIREQLLDEAAKAARG